MKPKILLVEDDAMTRDLLIDVLCWAHYHVIAVPDGEAAVALLNDGSFDLVITDLQLPQIDGIQVLQAARKVSEPPEVIVQTGYGSLETAIAALRGEAYDYLLKPYTPADLLECVDRAMQRRLAERRKLSTIRTINNQFAERWSGWDIPDGGQPALRAEAVGEFLADEPHMLHIGALTIDCLRRMVFFDGQTVHVTPIEFALLHCLARADGRVVDGPKIVRYTHGHNVDGAEAQLLLKAHVRNLRRKIDPRYLLNIRSIGYRLAPPEESYPATAPQAQARIVGSEIMHVRGV